MFCAKDEQSIVALCSPRGSGAIALLRICGPSSFEIVDKFSKLSSGKKIVATQTHTINHGFIIDETTQENIDEVMFIVMKAPKTFTGQDTIEITCHNNPFIIEKIINLVIKFGGRAAQPGEFSKRAVIEGKLDLIKAEAINELIGAQNQTVLKNSLQKLHGSLSFYVAELESLIFEILTYSEASFEFLEEEQRDLSFDDFIKNHISKLKNLLKSSLENFSYKRQIQEGIRVALIGSTNAGKSTLFNSLLGRNRAIVSDIAGTTRDSIEGTLYKTDIHLTVIDTAGLRDTYEIIEKEGIERSKQEAESCDIILLVIDAITFNNFASDFEFYFKILEKYSKKVIIVLNKIDLIENQENIQSKVEALFEKINFEINGIIFNKKIPIVSISAKNKKGLSDLQTFIDTKTKELISSYDSAFLLNERQYKILLQLDQIIEKIETLFSNRIEYELISYHLREALENISELTGKGVHEKMLDKVFLDFCVGK